MSKRITLKDVAERAGVSYQTVSKVVNGTASVSADTERAIWSVVEELGYRANATARNLRQSATRLIGYSWEPNLPTRISPILDQFLSSTVGAAEAAGYHLLLFPTHRGPRPEDAENVDQAAAYRELIRAGRVDGFIITSTNYGDPRIRLLSEMRFPFVAFGRADPEWHFPYVDVDGRAGLRAATAHLIAQGHRAIGLLGWPAPSRAGTARENGYREAMQMHGLPVDPAWVLHGEGSAEIGYALTERLLELPPGRRPSAVAAVDDLLAVGAMRAALAHGLAVGADFGVTGYDDTPGVQYLTPPLTSLRQPIAEVGQRIVEMLTALLAGRPPDRSEVVLAPQLIVRDSSLRPGEEFFYSEPSSAPKETPL